MNPRPLARRPKRRLTGSTPGHLNSRDVGWSFAESATWSGFIGSAIYGLELLGHELQSALPFLAMSLPTETVLTIAGVSFLLIFVAKLRFRNRDDNRPEGSE